jgi:hypothetical protein
MLVEAGIGKPQNGGFSSLGSVLLGNVQLETV